MQEKVIRSGVRDHIFKLRDHLNTRILGQENLISRLLIALLADGHLLVEGAPGLAKTRAVKELSHGIEGHFHRTFTVVFLVDSRRAAHIPDCRDCVFGD